MYPTSFLPGVSIPHPLQLDQSKHKGHSLRAVWISFSPFFTSVKNPFKNLRPLKQKRGRNVIFEVHVRRMGRHGRQTLAFIFYDDISGTAGNRARPVAAPPGSSLPLPFRSLWPFAPDAPQGWFSKCGPTASASPEGLLERQTLCPTLDLLGQKLWIWGGATRPPQALQVGSDATETRDPRT